MPCDCKNFYCTSSPIQNSIEVVKFIFGIQLDPTDDQLTILLHSHYSQLLADVIIIFQSIWYRGRVTLRVKKHIVQG